MLSTARTCLGWLIPSRGSWSRTVLMIGGVVLLSHFLVDLAVPFSARSHFSFDRHGYRLSPDGKTLVTLTPDEVCLWDAKTGKRRKRLFAANRPQSELAFSPDSREVAVRVSPGTAM